MAKVIAFPEESLNEDAENPLLAEMNLVFSGYLFFGRYFAPETLATGETEPRALAAALLSTRRFLIDTVEPALDGSLSSSGEPVDQQIVAWAEAAFDLSPGAGADRFGLLARVLESDFVCAWSKSSDLPWSAKGLAGACHRVARTARTAMPVNEHIVAISQGVSKLSLHDIDAENERGELKFNSNSAWIEFELGEANTTTFGVWRLDFGFLSESSEPQGSLYLDYGRGFSNDQSLALIPKGRSRYPAFVHSAGLKRLRWMPDRNARGGVITVLNARHLANHEFEALALNVMEQGGLDRVQKIDRALSTSAKNDPQSALRLSQHLTTKLGGHWDDEADYAAWIRRNELSRKEARLLWSKQLTALKSFSLVSILIVLPDLENPALDMCLSSLFSQVYTNWRLHLVVPSGVENSPALSEWMEKDRARITITEAALGDSATPGCQARIELQSVGEWLLQIEQGDVLTPNALLALIDFAAQKPLAEVIYADEDQLDVNGFRTNPLFKHAYRSDQFLPRAQLGNFVAHRLGGVGMPEGSLVVDLRTRQFIDETLGERDANVFVHIPQILLHRFIANEGAISVERKPEKFKDKALGVVKNLTKTALGKWYPRIRADAAKLIHRH